LLFGRLARRDQIPDGLAPPLALQHPNITLFSSYLLVKAFKQIGRTDQGDKRPREIHGQGAQGLLDIHAEVPHSLRFPLVPRRAKDCGPVPSFGGHIGALHLPRLRYDGVFARPFRPAHRFGRGKRGVSLQVRRAEGVGDIFALVEKTPLVRNAREMPLQGLWEPLGAITDDHLGRLFRDPFNLQLPDEGMPRRRVLLGRTLPVHALPVAIGPHAEGGSHDALLLAFDGSTTAEGLRTHLLGRRGHLAPEAIDEDDRGRDRQGPRLPCLHALFPPADEPVPGLERPHFSQREPQRFLEVPQTQPQAIAPYLLVQQWPPASFVACDGLPAERAVPSPECGHAAVWDARVLC